MSDWRSGVLLAAEALVAEVGDALCDNAGRFTCDEADVVVEFFKAFGRLKTADVFLRSHIEGDEDDDRHLQEAER